MRYTASFSFDADDFASARRIARQMRNALRGSGRGEEFDSDDYADLGVKLLKLRDPEAAGTSTSTDTDTGATPVNLSQMSATPVTPVRGMAEITVRGSLAAVGAVLSGLDNGLDDEIVWEVKPATR